MRIKKMIYKYLSPGPRLKNRKWKSALTTNILPGAFRGEKGAGKRERRKGAKRMGKTLASWVGVAAGVRSNPLIYS